MKEREVTPRQQMACAVQNIVELLAELQELALDHPNAALQFANDIRNTAVVTENACGKTPFTSSGIPEAFARYCEQVAEITS